MSKLPQWVNMLVFILLLVLVIQGMYVMNDMDRLPDYLEIIIFGIVVLVLILYIIFRIKKSKAISEEQSRLQKDRNSVANEIDPDQSILYLRPFKADANEVHAIKHGGQKMIRKSRFKKIKNSFNVVRYDGKTYSNIETLICQMLNGKGVPIAIGDPNEISMESGISIGAQRIYATDETWKDKVDFFLTCSKMVILYVDFTEGVMWEINRAIDEYQNKVVFIPKLYNKRDKALTYISVMDALSVIFSPIYYIKYKTFVFPHLRRGCIYYKRWRSVFGFDINDRICAVRVINGNPIFYETSTGLIGDQLRTVHSAILEHSQKTTI